MRAAFLFVATALALHVPRRHAIASAVAAALAPRVKPAEAWCGEQFPPWAYYLKWDQIAVPFEYGGVKGETFCRVVGDVAREQKAGVPPVLLVGNPGVGYDYMENMEALSVSDRRVIEVVFAGTAKGDATPAALLSADAQAAQLRAICATLKLSAVHVVSHGLGAVPALRLLGDPALPAVVAPKSDGGSKDCSTYKSDKAREYCEREAGAKAGPGVDALAVRSLALVSPYASPADLKAGAREALNGPGALVSTWYGDAAKSCVAEAASAGGGPALAALLSGGGAESLRGEALAQALRKATSSSTTPTLIATGGDRDIVDDSGWVASLPSTVKYAKFEGAGHLPFIEARDSFLLTLLAFMDGADGVETNRELKFADPIQTIKETKAGLAL